MKDLPPSRASVRFLVGALLAALLLTAVPAPASAGIVAPDAHTAVRQILYPLVGASSYGDTFGACRGTGCSRGHEGTDIMAAKLVPIVAAREGVVTGFKNTATPDGSQGNYLIVRDADGWEYWYIHINNDSPGTDDGKNPQNWAFGPGIQRGAVVNAGQLIAYVGDSGNAELTAPHLHFEIHKPDGTIINPYRSLRAAKRISTPTQPDARIATSTDAHFVKALYADFLDRAPTSNEVVLRAYETRTFGRASVANGFANSHEWVSVLVDGFYRSTLGRAPDESGLTYWTNKIRAGMTAAEAASHFYASSEYFNRTGGTSTAWVTSLYAELLGRTPDSGGLRYWAGQVDRGVPRPQVAGSFYGSAESRRERVEGLYQDLLGRKPDSGGLRYWAGVLRHGNDVRLAEFLAVSSEYHSKATTRFG